ncbi:MAG: hypothetical protein AB8C02_14150 [Halioglobus sp.]
MTAHTGDIPAIIRKETRNNIIINTVINAVIAYFLFKKHDSLPVWGENSYGEDLIIGGFILSIILAGIFIALFRHRVKQGQVQPEGHEGKALAWLIPYNVWLATPWLGFLGAAIFAPLLIGLLLLVGADTLTPVVYAAIKGVWAGALAGVITVIAITQGLRTPQ